jgi:HPt (histidine-containing phosphotransfer) domain-containing protein
MNDYIAKPIDANHLLHKIAHWISKEKRIPEETAHFVYTSPILADKVSSDGEMMSELDGFDVQTGLGRLGGNQELYRKLLVKFRKNHKEAIAEIRSALDSGDKKEAEILAHTIKGAAGNIGARDVYLDAGALEAELKTEKPDGVEPLLKQLDQTLVQIFTSIALLGNDDEDSVHSNVEGAELHLLKISLLEMKKLLQDNNMDAVESAQTIIMHAKNTPFAEITAKIKNHVDQYDFEGALVILNEILMNI